jgi:phospholipid/cholesterol/gamma-HCH transport system permease protein
VSSPTVVPVPRESARRRISLPRNPFKGLEGPLVQAGEMTRLLLQVLWMAVRHPLGYWGEVRDQMFDILKLCWIPMAVSCTAFGLGAPGLQGGNLFSLFGIPERLGSFFVMASVREFAPWVNAMVVAGVVGTAITADIGARRIREEIDAMEVLGVDPIRTLVLPRVVALFFMTGLLDLAAILFGLLGGYIAAVPILGANPAAFVLLQGPQGQRRADRRRQRGEPGRRHRLRRDLDLQHGVHHDPARAEPRHPGLQVEERVP